MLRLAVDATAVPSKKAGAGNYIYNLIEGLAAIDSENQYFILIKTNQFQDIQVSDSSNFHLINCGNLSRRFLRLAWEQVCLPGLLNKLRIQVLHSPHYTMPLHASCRRVVSIMDMTFFLFPEMHVGIKQLFFPWMISRSARRADHIITISSSTRNDFIRLLGMPRCPVTAIPLAAAKCFRLLENHQEILRRCSKYGLAKDRYLICVGVLEPRKNLLTLIKAFRIVADQDKTIKLAIIGRPGWMFQEIFELVKTLSIGDRIVFTGYVVEDDLPYLYNGALASVYPSVYEGFGLPVLEAMASGTPVLTSNISSMPEVAGEAGHLVNSVNDPDEWARAILRIINDSSLRAKMRESGLSRAKGFTWERTARETVKVYRETAREGLAGNPGDPT